ncbi:MAG: MBL fold metallo-hydrolase RNA specificity domain-containing protein [Acidimicrobiia bacterium]
MSNHHGSNHAPTLQFLGGVGTVTGSKFCVRTADASVLVDCGLYQGHRELRARNWEDPNLSIGALDAVVITHAHVDHCGYLPRLVKSGFSGPVYVTAPTARLISIVLPDSAHLQEEEATYANRKGYSRHDPALPLYTQEDAYRALELLRPIDLQTPTVIADGIELTFSRSGHILGSASATLRLVDPNGSGDPVSRDHGITVCFSGDLGRPSHPFLVAPDPPPESDWILVESTYGDRRHDDEGTLETLASVINTTIERGGSVLIPAFAVDRTEVILFHLAALMADDRIESDIPVYVDSPMAIDALRVYRDEVDRSGPDIRPSVVAAAARGEDPFIVPGLQEVRDIEGSIALNNPTRPCIIISAAGMASGGRVVHHLAHMLPERRNTVVLVGYQAEGTRGRQLVDGATELKMLGRYVRVRAQIVDLPAFSVHADAGELVDWVRSAPSEPEGVFVVHGESDASAALAEAISSELDWGAITPRPGEKVRLDRWTRSPA